MTRAKEEKAKNDHRATEPAKDAEANGTGEEGQVDAKADATKVASNDEKKQVETNDEDAILKRGEEIASKRALMAQAFKPPCPEPERPLSHRSHMLGEMKWLAIDMAQERLWKQSVALALAIEIGKLEGNFGLKQPPADCRQFSDEIKQLKLEMAKASGQSTGRRSAKSVTLPPPSVLLDLDAENDPALREVEDGIDELKKQAKEIGEGSDAVINLSEKNPDLTLLWDDATTEKIEGHLMELEKARLIKEEAQYRSYRMEYEAALASHQLAIEEQHAAANAIDAFEIGQSLDLDLMDDGLLGPPKRAFKRRKGPYGAEEYDDRKYEGYGDRRRNKSYREVDNDYSTDGGRYGRRGPAGRNRKPLNDRNRNVRPGRPDGYGQGRIQGQPGILSWNKSEDDLLLAVVHEFGVNWTLVSEVLSRSLSMQGIHRPAQQCRQRFRQLIMHEGQSLTDEKAYELLSARLGKQQARELLMTSLPVRDEALVRFLEALAQVGASAKNRLLAEERRCESVRTQRQETHNSYQKVLSGVLQQTGGRRLNPLEISAHVMNTYSSQSRQLPAQGYAAGNPPSHTGNPIDGSNGQTGIQSSVGIPAGPQAPLAQGVARPASGVITAQNVQQLNAILTANKLPNGTELTDEMRKALEERRKQYIARLQQQKQFALRGMPGQIPSIQGQPPGQITSGTALGAMQTGVRPQMGNPAMNAHPSTSQAVHGNMQQGLAGMGQVPPAGQQYMAQAQPPSMPGGQKSNTK